MTAEPRGRAEANRVMYCVCGGVCGGWMGDSRGKQGDVLCVCVGRWEGDSRAQGKGRDKQGYVLGVCGVWGGGGVTAEANRVMHWG